MLRYLQRLVLCLLIGLLFSTRTATAQDPAPPADDAAQALFEQMTVAERVGQLFLVTFQGDTVALTDDIASLILEYHIGGVVLSAENGNISPDDTVRRVQALTSNLQRLALRDPEFGLEEGEENAGDTSVGDPVPPSEADVRARQLLLEPGTALPLLIATQHEGDGYPHSQIRFGLTPLPNQMAVGATWEPANARTVGQIVGSELSALGVNMLLGPSLDVLENPDPNSASDLGTRTFGGDPFWVGLMGEAYVQGVAEGSSGRMAVIAKHFPGYGGSDRPLNQDIATVRKSLAELVQLDLVPFFAVTAPQAATAPPVDGLLTTHIRYQGLQGNIRATTAPVSFSLVALNELMALPQLAQWRGQGGIIVSDALGVRAVQRFYDVTGQEFPHRQVAKDAFLAGNDLLYLSEFALGARSSAYADQLANIQDTIRWFGERYETEPAFRQRVDDSVLRLLRLKLRLYGGELSAESVLPDPAAVDQIGSRAGSLVNLPGRSITLIAPQSGDSAERLPGPPATSDRIVIFTDARQARPCPACPPEPLLDPGALERHLLNLYGPRASNQIDPSRVVSFTFADLNAFLDAGGQTLFPPLPEPTLIPPPDATATPEGFAPTPVPSPTPSPGYRVQEALRDADWLLFALLDVTQDSAESNALKRFLDERPDLARNANVVVFAYNAPYYLDATDISKLAAYFVAYTKIDLFVEASIAALFGDLSADGDAPVSISGIGYDLFNITQPNPSQQIGLSIVRSGIVMAPSRDEPIKLETGETIELRTGIIRDRNGNVVPDGTQVRFIQVDLVDGLLNVETVRETVGGIASLTFALPEGFTGNIRLRVTAGEANRSDEVNIIGDEASIATPTPLPTPTVTPTPSPTPTPRPTNTPRPTRTPTTTAPVVNEPRPPAFEVSLDQIQQLLGVIGGIGIIIGGSVYLTHGRAMPLVLKLRLLLWGMLGGLVAYNYLAAGLPGTASLATLGAWRGFVMTAAGGLLGVIGFYWAYRSDRLLRR